MPMPPASEPPKERHVAQSEQLLSYLGPRLADWYQIFDHAARLDATLPPNDVIAIFAPVDFLGEGTDGLAQGQMFYNSPSSRAAEQPAVLGFPHMRVYTIVMPTDFVDMDQFIQINLHEIAHEFGLEHNPGDARQRYQCPGNGSVLASELPGRNVDGIEAWRMTVDGLDGWNKSQEEGNAQAKDGTLVSMMWPFAMSTNLMSLQEREYVRLQKSITDGPASVWRESSVLPLFDRMPPLLTQRRYAQSTTVRTDAVNLEERLVITGRLSDTGLQIRGIDRMVDDWPSPSPGAYHAELLDARGRTLARAPLGLRAPLDPVGNRAPADRMGWSRFRVSLPLDGRAHRLVIREGEKIRAHLPMPETDVQITAPRVTASEDESLLIEWDATGPVTRTEISYSPDGEAPWHAVELHVSGQAFRLDQNQLAPGPSPTLRITGRVGLRFADGFVPLPLPARRKPEDHDQ
jgi:hypothetical protein